MCGRKIESNCAVRNVLTFIMHKVPSSSPSQFKVVRCTTVDELTEGDVLYRERLEEYPFAVPEWDRLMAIRRAAAGEILRDSSEKPEDASSSEVDQRRKSSSLPILPEERFDVPVLPDGELPFAPGLAFVYVMHK